MYNLRLPLFVLLPLCLLMLVAAAHGQSTTGMTYDTLTREACVAYALRHQPEVRQALLDEDIGDADVRANLSGWLPQVNVDFAASHNIRRQRAVFGDQIISIGANYASNILLQANQTIYSNELLLAARAAHLTRLGDEQMTTAAKIDAVVNVSKAFYDILLTQEQLTVLADDIERQRQQYQDAYSRYNNGLVDKTDYQRASITLANTRSSLKRTQESLQSKFAQLKQLIGFPIDQPLILDYTDPRTLNDEVLVDTLAPINYQSRVEFRQLQTQLQLQELNTQYYRIGWIPSLSAFINYNPLFFGNSLDDLYNTLYSTSVVGINASLPLFTGTRRLQNVKSARLREDRLRLELENLQRTIHTQYETALANYKSDYYDWQVLRENAETAREVYRIIKLQYDEGIKAYVELLVAESDLQSAQLNYYNALYQLLASKLDYERAAGLIPIK